jgi:hypothetical protein
MTHRVRGLNPLVWALVATVLFLALCYAWGGWEVDRSLGRLNVSRPVAAKVHTGTMMQG